MIVKERTTWLRMLFAVRGSSLTDTWKRILFVFIVSIVVTIYHEYIIAHGWTHYSLTPLPFTLIGVALGIFLLWQAVRTVIRSARAAAATGNAATKMRVAAPQHPSAQRSFGRA